VAVELRLYYSSAVFSAEGAAEPSLPLSQSASAWLARLHAPDLHGWGIAKWLFEFFLFDRAGGIR
jgi:hypothetical protein